MTQNFVLTEGHKDMFLLHADGVDGRGDLLATAQNDKEFAPRIYTYLHGTSLTQRRKGRGDLWAHGIHGRTQNF